MRYPLILLFIILFSSSYAFAQQKPVIVTATPVKEGITGPMTEITGSVYFSLFSSVAAENSGKVDKVYINEGDSVKAGSPLAYLDDRLLSYEISAAVAATSQAEATLAKTKRDYERNKSLYEQNAIAQITYDNSLTDYQNAESSYLAAIANEKKLKTQKEKMIIKAPFDGVITSKDVNVGEWVNAGGVIAGIAALDFEAKVYLPERVLNYIKKGDKVVVSADARQFEGEVLSVNSKGDAATRTFLTRIHLGVHPQLKEGILATVKVPTGPVIKSLLVPRDTVVTINGQKGVYLIDNDKAVFIPVTILANSGSDLAIDGHGKLKIEDMIVMNGNDKIKDGFSIKIVQGIGK